MYFVLTHAILLLFAISCIVANEKSNKKSRGQVEYA